MEYHNLTDGLRIFYTPDPDIPSSKRTIRAAISVRIYGDVYLCTNDIALDGSDCEDKKGFEFSYCLGTRTRMYGQYKYMLERMCLDNSDRDWETKNNMR